MDLIIELKGHIDENHEGMSVQNNYIWNAMVQFYKQPMAFSPED